MKKSISNTEYESKNDKNHCRNPFSMVSIDSYTGLTTISNFEIWCPTLTYNGACVSNQRLENVSIKETCIQLINDNLNTAVLILQIKLNTVITTKYA